MKLKAGIHILILTMVFFLTACSANDNKSGAEPTIKEDTIISDSDTQTKRIENELEEQNELEDQPTNHEEAVDRERKEDPKKETKGEGKVVASIPEPAEDLDSASDQQEEDRTLEQLLDDGFTVIEEQSFWMDTDYWGHVRFVAGYYIKNKVPHLNFYIVNSNQLVMNTLPESFPNNPNLRHINAVSFRDLNDDGEKDIIIIGEYVGGDTTKPAISVTRASVYFFTGQSYIQLPWYNDLINRSGKNDTVNLVVKEGERILKLILTPKTRSADNETEFDRMAPLMCSKELFDLGDTGYASIYDSLNVFSSPSTYSESYLTSLIGNCFEQDTKLLISTKPVAFAKKVNRYEQLVVDIVNDINHYNYIETGGGTMWTIINAYSILDVHTSVNKYVRGKTLSDQGNIRTSINSLSSGWNQLQSEMNIVIKEGGFEESDLMEWTGATLDDIVELEHRLDANIQNLIELAATDKKAKDVVDLINNHLYSETY
ncbi:hypothetical protein J2T13_000370 [Paenibacillus sp. DS2015]|uniref:hypothetical protein n=1 Tax=Paenibacillus sp. DS2015 TaxID=3373917 RepID=UPI003D20588D